MGVWLMSFGLSKGGSSTTPSNQDKEQGAVIVRTDDNNPELFKAIVRELKLLSTRFEEAFRTNINKGDINNED